MHTIQTGNTYMKTQIQLINLSIFVLTTNAGSQLSLGKEKQGSYS